MLTAAVGGAIARPDIGAARAQPAKKTFVLVHGSFCGGWITSVNILHLAGLTLSKIGNLPTTHLNLSQ